MTYGITRWRTLRHQQDNRSILVVSSYTIKNYPMHGRKHGRRFRNMSMNEGVQATPPVNREIIAKDSGTVLVPPSAVWYPHASHHSHLVTAVRTRKGPYGHSLFLAVVWRLHHAGCQHCAVPRPPYNCCCGYEPHRSDPRKRELQTQLEWDTGGLAGLLQERVGGPDIPLTKYLLIE